VNRMRAAPVSRGVRTAVGILLLAGLASAQDPLDQLASENTGDRAWGAFRAGELGVQEAVPVLRRALARGDIRSHALDALIRLDARLDWQELEPHLAQYPAQVFILLARRPEANRDGLRALVRDPSGDLLWLGACNLLATLKDEALAGLLLAGLELELELSVVDGGSSLCGGGGGSGSGGRGCMRVLVTPGRAPAVFYRLVEKQGPDARPIAPGLHPIWYERIVLQKSGGLSAPARRRRDRHALRLDYVAQLLDTVPERLPVRRQRYAHVSWTDAESCRADVAAARRELEKDHARLVARLQERGLLPESAEIAPKIVVTVHDRRGDRSVPLPELP